MIMNLPCGCTDQMIDEYMGLQNWEIPDDPVEELSSAEPDFCIWLAPSEIPF